MGFVREGVEVREGLCVEGEIEGCSRGRVKCGNGRDRVWKRER